MALIFISYSSRHRDLTQVLATAIEAQYGSESVWWDHALESRAEFEPQINAALESARVVVVIWSIGATASDFVYSEASEAARAGKLINVRPVDVPFNEIPKPFDIYHIDDLANTDRILATIADVMRGLPVPTRVPLAEIYFRQHGKRVLDEKQVSLPADVTSIAPSELLQAKYAVVDYDDATGMAQRVLTWCLADGATAGRLVHGTGGSGKTRLMTEVAARLRQDHGWQAGFLDPPSEDHTIARQRWQALEQLISDGVDRGLLLVMDYAEARQRELVALAEHLRSRRADNALPIRLTLLTRSAGEWWTMLVDENDALQGLFQDRPGEPAAILMPTMVSVQHRLRHFRACLRAMEPVMRPHGYQGRIHEPSSARLARIESDDDYAHPLAIQMEALLELASETGEAEHSGLDKLLGRVLGLERSHWTKLLIGIDDERRRDLRRAVAQVTAMQGLETTSSAEQLLMADRFYSDRAARATVDPMVRSLILLYGRPNGGIGPLEPDLIGEHHVAITADIELIEGCLSWVENEAEALRARRRKDLLTVLQRATQAEHGEAATRVLPLLDYIIGNHGATIADAIVEVMRVTPGALFNRLEAALDKLSEPVLAAINFELPVQHVSWMEFSLRVAQRYAIVARRWNTVAAEDLAPDERRSQRENAANGMDILGLRLSNLGRLEEALTASQEAVEINRVLVKESPNEFLPSLARSLTKTAIMLRRLSRFEDASAAFSEAGSIFGTLIKDRPVEFFADLQFTLNSFAVLASRIGLHEMALKAFLMGVDSYRAMVKDGFDSFLPNLATSLNNAAATLSNLERLDDAIAASEEAVKIARLLAEDQPEAFRPDLAMYLVTLGGSLFRIGRGKEAWAVIVEALNIYMALDESHPDGVFFPDLTKTLSKLGRQQSAIGQFEDALITSQQVVENFRALAEDRPDVFREDLANSLDDLGVDLRNLNRYEEGLVAHREAVELYRQLATTQSTFIPDLARSLGFLSGTLARAEKYAESANAAHAGLAAIVDFPAKEPRTFGGLMRSLRRDYVEASEKAANGLDNVLLMRVKKVLGEGLEAHSRAPS